MPTSLKYNIAFDNQGEGSITITKDGVVTTLDDTHPNFDRVATALVANEDPFPFLSIEAAVTRIDDRVSVIDGVLNFDGEPVNNGLTNTIVRYVREGRDPSGLVKFMERLENNPSRRSREQLFNWVQSKDLTVNSEGFFIGYKGVNAHFKSIHSGDAIVDGIPMNGQVPNEIGSVISMAREKVQDDPNQGCSYGLHVGTYAYANSFGHHLLEVQVDPANVVSVPADCGFQKLRCCEYTVLALHEQKYDDLYDHEPDAEWDADDDERLDALEVLVPTAFMDKIRARFGIRQ